MGTIWLTFTTWASSRVMPPRVGDSCMLFIVTFYGDFIIFSSPAYGLAFGWARVIFEAGMTLVRLPLKLRLPKYWFPGVDCSDLNVNSSRGI